MNKQGRSSIDILMKKERKKVINLIREMDKEEIKDAHIIDGKKIAAEITSGLKVEVAEHLGKHSVT